MITAKLRWRWSEDWWPTKPGRKGWSLYCNGQWVAGIVRYRWRTSCIGYLRLPSGDRDVARGSTPGPVKHRVKQAALAHVRGGGTFAR